MIKKNLKNNCFFLVKGKYSYKDDLYSYKSILLYETKNNQTHNYKILFVKIKDYYEKPFYVFKYNYNFFYVYFNDKIYFLPRRELNKLQFLVIKKNNNNNYFSNFESFLKYLYL